MTTNLVNTEEVRIKTGAPSSLISDSELIDFITDTQEKILEFLRVSPTPVKRIEMLDGNNKRTISINRPFLLKVLELKTRDTSFDLQNVKFDLYSGIITVDNTQNPYYFEHGKDRVRVKYLSGFMDRSEIVTETTADVQDGDSVVVAVEDESEFSVNDWVIIQGMDGKIESAQITSISSQQITVDKLVQDHESGSLVTKLETSRLLKQYILYECSVGVAVNAVGSTFEVATSYSVPEFTITKGVPYTHWKESFEKNQQQRDQVLQKLRNRLSSMA